MSIPLSPIADTDLDAMIQQVSTDTIALAERLQNVATWGKSVLTPEALAAGQLVKAIAQPTGIGIVGYEPMTQADVDAYLDIFTKLLFVWGLLGTDQGSNPAGTQIVRPWARTGNVPLGMMR